MAVLKSAYPKSFAEMTRTQMDAMVSVWQGQFHDIPMRTVAWAVDKHIKTEKFSPSISEIWDAISDRKEKAHKALALHDMFLRAGENHTLPNEAEFIALTDGQIRSSNREMPLLR